MKILVSFFSASGVTKKLAEKIAKVLNADLFEIEPETKYSKADLNWMDKNSRSSVEMSNPLSRPAILNKVDDINQYDIIFVGFPIWWYVAPTIINTFIESYDFTNKTIVPFATSGSSGIGNTEKILKSLCSSKTKWCPGTVLKHNISDKELMTWIKSLDIDLKE